MQGVFIFTVFVLVFGASITTLYGQLTVQVAAQFRDTFCEDGDDCDPFYCGNPEYATCGSSAYPDPPQFQTRWGEPASWWSAKSGLGFTPNTPNDVNFDTDFYLGMLTHFNFPIRYAAYQTTLVIKVQFFATSSGLQLAQQDFTFDLEIDETTNSDDEDDCPYPSSTPCSDKISYPTGGFDFASKFVVSGVNYTLQLKGFKESSSSSSLALDSFISNESGTRVGYLFARITAACPNVCVGEGSVIINSQQQCVCDCSELGACPYPQSRRSDCACTCPENSCTNNGITLPDCSCNCTNSVCPMDMMIKNPDCSCSCPSNWCKNGGVISDYDTCACDCSTADLDCVSNEVVSPTCECLCNMTCPSPKVRINNPVICGCTCNNTCPTGYSRDPETCNCTCLRTCPNGPVDYTDCTCGPCEGNWTKSILGECTVCGLANGSCSGLEELDSFTCKCACVGLSTLCNATAGQVPDANQACGCRNCTAGECMCGNGIVEPGEECDNGFWVSNQCCSNVTCTWMPGESCDDGNRCSINDICYIGGLCKGVYKCDQSTTCTDIHCNTTTGDCINTQHANGSICPSAIGRNDGNLCLKACQSGICSVIPPVQCIDNNTQDCMVPVCQNSTGACIYVGVPDNSACNDGDGCTTNDVCISGICSGVTKDCELEFPDFTQCQEPRCDTTDGFCKVYPKPNGEECNDGNLCTLNDRCSNGQCVARRNKRCPKPDQCKSYICELATGNCLAVNFPNETICFDNNTCTVNDTCTDGLCQGLITDETLKLPECGFVPSKSPNTAGQDTLVFFLAAGGAALVGAIVGSALIIKKIRRDKLLDPDSWNPDSFSSVGSNPFFQASQKMMDNRLYNPDTSVE